MFKKVLSVMIAVALCFSLISVTAFADSATPYDISGATKSSNLGISGSTATCGSSYDGSTVVKSIKIVQSLEKHSYLWVWDTVGSELSRTETDTDSMSFTNIRVNITSGTYRVKSVFTVTLYDGTSETVTVYSQEVTV